MNRLKEKNKLLLIVLICFVIFSGTAYSQEFSDVTIQVDGVQVVFDNPPIIRDGRTLAPLRAVFEQLGLTVSWNDEDRSITGEAEGIRIWLQIDNEVTIVNGEEVIIDVPAFIIEGRSYVPVRFLAEATGCDVDWDGETRTVFIDKPILEKKFGGHIYVDNEFTYFKNDYSLKNLRKLADAIDVDESIEAFRADNDNEYRKDLIKQSFKFFDLYYPDTDEGHQHATFISDYADEAYAFLIDFFDGRQAPVEVHLVREDVMESSNLSEGDIRRENHVTYVYMTDYSLSESGSVIVELVHEMYHNFMSINNDLWDYRTEYKGFVDEGIGRIIGSIFVEDMADESGDYNYFKNYMTHTYHHDVYNIRRMSTETNYTPDMETSIEWLRNNNWWGNGNEGRITRDMVITFWMYQYNTKGMDVIKEILNTIGSDEDDNLKVSMERVFEEPLENTFETFENFIYEERGNR